MPLRGLAQGTATTGLAIMLSLAAASVAAASPALASAKSTARATAKPTSKAKAKTKAKPPARPAAVVEPLPEPVQGCLGEHGSPAPKGIPWPQQTLDYQSVWPFTQGGGVTVAVIDSGVDANPQFGHRVLVGPTLVRAQSGPANGDCTGHGTSVAGIIAAAPITGVSFAGVAPAAEVLSIKVTNTETGVASSLLPEAITDAVAEGAKVINLSLIAPDTSALRDAVEAALSRNVVVVASAGNDTPDTGTGPFYPAAYPGVLSVGAVNSGGNLANFSDAKTPVSVTAPGVDITSAFPGVYPDSYYAGQDGTSFATAFVSGIAALVRSRYPRLSAAQVTSRIEETADGAEGPGTGAGLVNPVQAVTAVLPAGSGTARTTAGFGRVSIIKAAPDGGEMTVAMTVTVGAFGVAVLVIAAAIVVPAGRRRRWRA